MRSPHHTRPTPVEPLESRIAPAAIFVNSKTVTYPDLDGDTVTIAANLPLFESTLSNLTFTPDGNGHDHLDALTLAGFSGNSTTLTLTIKAARGPLGDGLVNVGYINASGHDLSAVTVVGDLGQIDAGDSSPSTPALRTLTVNSLGLFGAQYGPLNSENRECNFIGSLGSVKILHDLKEASLVVTSGGAPNATPASASIASILIGGSLVGSDSNNTGKISTEGSIGTVLIGGSIRGGNGNSSGSIDAGTTLGNVTIAGSLLGSDGSKTGRIRSTMAMGIIKIGQNIEGGDGSKSGTVSSDVSIKSVTVGCSILGGAGDGSGSIKAIPAADATPQQLSTTCLGPVIIGGSVIGADIPSSSTSSINGTGTIEGRGIASVRIAGSLIAGKNKTTPFSLATTGSISSASALLTDLPDTTSLSIGLKVTIGSFTAKILSIDSSSQITLTDTPTATASGTTVSFSSPTLTDSGIIHSDTALGPVTILGDLRGSSTNKASITALGSSLSTLPAIKSILISGSAKNAFIGAGHTSSGTGLNPDAQIGSVSVLHDWIASSIAAGIAPTDAFFGNSDDASITPSAGFTNSPTIVSKIASILIGGQLIGSDALDDSFGFVAESIGSLKISGTSVFTHSTTSKASRSFSSATGFDVRLREI